MASKEKTRSRAATTNRENGGAGALAGCVKIVTAFNAAMSAGAFALAVAWGPALPAAGLAVAFAVSASMLAFKSKGGAA